MLTTYTDGSVVLADGKAMGAFGWIIPTADMHSEEDIMYSGGGREVMHTASLQYDRALPKHLPEGQRMSSTRMEAAAILSLHIALERLDPDNELEVRNGIDSKSAMQTYNKILHMQPCELYNIHNHDIWMLIKQFQSSRLINMFHVRAHMDKHLKDAYKAQGEEHSDDEIYELLTPDWKGNYHADEQADNMHRSGGLLPNNGLCELQEVVTYARDEPLLVALPNWIREDVRSINSMRYWNEHPDLTNGIKVDWKCMKSVTAGHRYLHQRIRFMKVLTDTFAYSQRRMQWRLLAPSKNKCVYCDTPGETQQHVLTECTSAELGAMREELYNDITKILTDSLQPKEGNRHPKRIQNRHKALLNWIPTMVPKLWSGDSNVPDTGIIIVDEAFQALEKADVAQTWRGVMPESLTRAIATIVPTHSLAHKTATAISVVVQDKVTRIW